MAFVDLGTKKIYGCKEDGYIWWHEKGHIEFNDSNFGGSLGFWKETIFIWAIYSLAIAVLIHSTIFSVLSVAMLFSYFLFYIFEELWCWAYAIKNKK